MHALVANRFDPQFTRVLHAIFANEDATLSDSDIGKPLFTLSYLYVTHQTRFLPFASKGKRYKEGQSRIFLRIGNTSLLQYFFELTLFKYFQYFIQFDSLVKRQS